MSSAASIAITERLRAADRRAAAKRSAAFLPPQVVLIGASTGGPQAMTKLLAGLASARDRLPFCVTLHMPAELMPVIAAHVARTCGIETCVVRQPRPLLPGTVYFAPGDQHLDFCRNGVGIEVGLKHGSPRDYCKPAVDVMFTSAAACFGPRALAVVLSGMGKDGLAGARAIVAAGGTVMVQDEASSAVWGMPGAIAKSNLASSIMPPEALAISILRRLLPARSRT